MDFASIKDSVSNLTLYDLKAGVRKVQNAVMNYTEMEAKVREATNNEPWGASSTIMQEIANGTYSYQLLNEIMPMIYKRFTEKSAEEWRQIYKALQLLEFLIKNGSERVIDDARSHLSLLKMLRQFQFYDQNGKDQGINVRNRAKELAELLSDVERIRSERKKSRSNRNKFGGVEGGAGGGGFSGGIGSGVGSSSRYGGFGSEDASYGGYTGAVYGDGGGFGGNTSSFNDSGRRDKFEEYDEGDDPSSPPSTSRHNATTATTSSARRKSVEPKKKEPEVDLFEFGEDEYVSVPPPSAGMRSVRSAGGDDDDFDDFISATPEPSITTASTSISGILPPPQTTTSVSANTQFAAPKPVSATQAPRISGLASISSMSPAPSLTPMTSTPASVNPSVFTSPPPLMQQASFSSQPIQPAQQPAFTPQPLKPTGYQAAQPNYYTSVQAQTQPQSQGISANKTGMSSSSSLTGGKPATSKPAAKGGDAFSNLWSSTSSSAGIAKGAAAKGPTMADLAKQKTAAGIWGTPSPASAARPQQSMGAPMAAQAQRMQPQQQSQPMQQQGGGAGAMGRASDDLLG